MVAMTDRELRWLPLASSESSRSSFSKPTAKVVIREQHKDLTKIPDYELTGHFAPAA